MMMSLYTIYFCPSDALIYKLAFLCVYKNLNQGVFSLRENQASI